MTHAMLLRVSAVRRALPSYDSLTTSLVGAILMGWDAKRDTADLAEATGLHEAKVCNVIWLDRHCRRAARPRVATA